MEEEDNKKLKKFFLGKSSPFDLKKVFPGYFTMNIFRGAVVIIILLFVFTIWSNGWQLRFKYYACSEASTSSCNLNYYNKCWGNMTYNESGGECVAPGETIYYDGEPNDHYNKFNGRAINVFLFSFIFNHIWFMRRTGEFFPKRNKKNGFKNSK